ncbi:hypothetical protein V6Z11_D02G157800 [Gossypium hirsutum]
MYEVEVVDMDEPVFLQCTHSVQIWWFASLSISQVFVNKFVEQLFDSDFGQRRPMGCLNECSRGGLLLQNLLRFGSHHLRVL